MLRVGYSPCCDPATRDPSPRWHDSRGWLVSCALRAGCSPCCDPATRDPLVPEAHVLVSPYGWPYQVCRFMSPTSRVMVALSALYNPPFAENKEDFTRASLDQGSGFPRELLPIPLGGREDSGRRNGAKKSQERGGAHEEGPSVQLQAASTKKPPNA